MRCLSRAAFDAASPLARGWGVEVGLTVDVLRAGLRDRRGALRAAPPGLRSRTGAASCTGPGSTATCGWRPRGSAGCGGPACAGAARGDRTARAVGPWRPLTRRRPAPSAGVAARPPGRARGLLRPAAPRRGRRAVAPPRPGLGPRGWAPGDLPLHLSSAAVTAALWAAYLLGGLAVLRGSGRRCARPRAAAARGVRSRCGLGLAAGAGRAGAADRAVRVRRPHQLRGVRADRGPGRRPVRRAAGDLARRHRPGDQRGRAAVDRGRRASTARSRPLVQAAVLPGRRRQPAPDGVGAARWSSWLPGCSCGGCCCGRRRAPPAAGRVDVLWTANPVVFGVGVLGAHLDLLATALALAAVVLAARRPVGRRGCCSGAALSTKVTYGVAGRGHPAGRWWVLERRVALRRAVALVVGARRRRGAAAPVGRAARLRAAAAARAGRSRWPRRGGRSSRC